MLPPACSYLKTIKCHRSEYMEKYDSHQRNLVELSFTSSHQWNMFLLLVELYSHWSMLEQSLWPALIGFCPLYLTVQP